MTNWRVGIPLHCAKSTEIMRFISWHLVVARNKPGDWMHYYLHISSDFQEINIKKQFNYITLKNNSLMSNVDPQIVLLKTRNITFGC